MSERKFVTAEWRKLIMANYEIEPAHLKKYVPYRTELDIWENKCYVSLVGFMFLNTRLKGFKVPLHTNFPEVNLRFYVRYRSSDKWKRGVVFINEFVPKPAISFVANTFYNEKYVTYRMKHSWQLKEKLDIGYYWEKNKSWNKLEATASVTPCDLVTGSKEEFITEHYWGYSSINDERTGEYEVQHPRWQIYPVEKFNIECDFKALYGDDFAALDQTTPASVFLAEGSPVTILAKKAL